MTATRILATSAWLLIGLCYYAFAAEPPQDTAAQAGTADAPRADGVIAVMPVDGNNYPIWASRLDQPLNVSAPFRYLPPYVPVAVKFDRASNTLNLLISEANLEPARKAVLEHFGAKLGQAANGPVPLVPLPYKTLKFFLSVGKEQLEIADEKNVFGFGAPLVVEIPADKPLLRQKLESHPEEVRFHVEGTYDLRSFSRAQVTVASGALTATKTFEDISGGKDVELIAVDRKGAQELVTTLSRYIDVTVEADDGQLLADIQPLLKELAKSEFLARILDRIEQTEPSVAIKELKDATVWVTETGRAEVSPAYFTNRQDALTTREKFRNDWDNTWKSVEKEAKNAKSAKEFHSQVKGAVDTGGSLSVGIKLFSGKASGHFKKNWDDLSASQQEEVDQLWKDIQQEKIDKGMLQKEAESSWFGEMRQGDTTAKSLRVAVVRKAELQNFLVVKGTVQRTGGLKTYEATFNHSLKPVPAGFENLTREEFRALWQRLGEKRPEAFDDPR